MIISLPTPTHTDDGGFDADDDGFGDNHELSVPTCLRRAGDAECADETPLTRQTRNVPTRNVPTSTMLGNETPSSYVGGSDVVVGDDEGPDGETLLLLTPTPTPIISLVVVSLMQCNPVLYIAAFVDA